jgi:hypothetical protein
VLVTPARLRLAAPVQLRALLLPHQEGTDYVRRALRNLAGERPPLVGRVQRAQQSYWFCTTAGLAEAAASGLLPAFTGVSSHSLIAPGILVLLAEAGPVYRRKPAARLTAAGAEWEAKAGAERVRQAAEAEERRRQEQEEAGRQAERDRAEADRLRALERLDRATADMTAASSPWRRSARVEARMFRGRLVQAGVVAGRWVRGSRLRAVSAAVSR